MIRIIVIISLLPVFFIPVIVVAQQKVLDNKDSILKFNDSVAEAFIKSPYPVSDSVINRHSSQLGMVPADSVYVMYQQAQTAYYLFKKNEFVQATRVFSWQLVTSKIYFTRGKLVIFCYQRIGISKRAMI